MWFEKVRRFRGFIFSWHIALHAFLRISVLNKFFKPRKLEPLENYGKLVWLVRCQKLVSISVYVTGPDGRFPKFGHILHV